MFQRMPYLISEIINDPCSPRENGALFQIKAISLLPTLPNVARTYDPRSNLRQLSPLRPYCLLVFSREVYYGKKEKEYIYGQRGMTLVPSYNHTWGGKVL